MFLFFFFFTLRPPPSSTLFPYTTLFRSPRSGPTAAPGTGSERPPPYAPSPARRGLRSESPPPQDRKSTRLNSSHVSISYAVFCLKKKKSKLFKRCIVLSILFYYNPAKFW